MWIQQSPKRLIIRLCPLVSLQSHWYTALTQNVFRGSGDSGA